MKTYSHRSDKNKKKIMKLRNFDLAKLFSYQPFSHRNIAVNEINMIKF